MTKRKPILITELSKLTMDRFIRCMVHGDYKALLKSGTMGKAKLLEAWDNILVEYAEKMDDDKYSRMIQLVTDISISTSKFKRVEMIIKVLRMYTSPTLIKELRKMGYPGEYKFDILNPNPYFRDLRAAYTKAKGLIVKVNQMRIELEKLQKGFDGEKASEDSFDDMFISMSEFMKYPVKPHETTVLTYCNLYKRMKNYSQKLKAKAA